MNSIKNVLPVLVIGYSLIMQLNYTSTVQYTSIVYSRDGNLVRAVASMGQEGASVPPDGFCPDHGRKPALGQLLSIFSFKLRELVKIYLNFQNISHVFLKCPW